MFLDNILITGGCGFLGVSLIKKLLALQSKNIRLIDNLSVGKKKHLRQVCEFTEINPNNLKGSPNGLELIVGDIRDQELAIKVAKGIDTIIHLAANTGVGPSIEKPQVDMSVNIIGTFNYLEASRVNKISKFIFASSGAPIGEVEPPIHEEIPPHPLSPYGASKLAGEGYCSAYKNTFGIETVVLRFGNVYGPGSINKSSVVAKFIRKAINGHILEIYGDGMQTRDFIYIDDLINAIIITVEKHNIGGEIFQIASNQETTIIEMTNKLINELKKQGVKNINIKNISIRTGDMKRNFSDTSKAKERLGWNAQINLTEGLSKTVSYFLNKIGKGVVE
jgi:UDP-glucose 4-epimerase